MAETAKFSVVFHCLYVQIRSLFLSWVARVFKMCFKGRVFFFSPPSLLRFTHTFCSPSLSLSHSLPAPGATDSSPLLTPSGFASAICGAKCSLQPSESPWSLLYIPWLIAAIEKWKPNLGKDLDVIEKEGFTLARTAVNRKAKLDNFFFFF